MRLVLTTIAISLFATTLLFADETKLPEKAPPTSPVAPVPKATKIAPPNADKEKAAAALITEAYRAEWGKAKTPEQRSAFSKLLMKSALETKEDPDGQYTLLRIARDVATQAGDSGTALDAVDKLQARFEVDGFALKMAVIEALSKAPKAPKQQEEEFIRSATSIATMAISLDKFNEADKLVGFANQAAKSARAAALIRGTEQYVKDIEQIRRGYDRAAEALATLKTKADDPAANESAGQYICFSKRDWKSGLPLLSLGNEGPAKVAAKLEIAVPKSSAERAALGDAWWEVSEKLESWEKLSVRVHAAEWYKLALPQLTGLAKAKAEARIARPGD